MARFFLRFESQRIINVKMMRKKELQEALEAKIDLLNNQSRRIELLEEKFTELRKKYFQLKYSGVSELKHIRKAS